MALLALLLVAWELAVHTFDVPGYILPPPSEVWTAFLEVRGTLPAHIRTTMTEALVGLGFAILVGVAFASLVVSVPQLRRAFYPLLVLSQNIPMIVMAPLLVVWFGFGLTPKVLIVALVGFFPIAVATTDGLLRADRDLIELVRSMGAGRWQVLRTVLIPSALPSFFAGLQISATYAVLAAVIGEWVGASSGLGLFITRAQSAFRVDRVLVAVLVIAAVSIAMFAAVHLIARLTMPYRYVSTEGEER